jgi:ABC-type Mn2+/Zn2+ transport system permease subunit
MPAYEVSLDHFLFGNILGIGNSDLRTTYAITCVALVLLVTFQRPLLLTIFEASVAKTQGVPVVGLLLGMLILLIVLAMVSSLQAVGVLLSLGLLILPAATIYPLSDSFDIMLGGGAALGTCGAVIGLLVSFWANIPSGPAIVLILGAFFLLAYLFSPRYGIISRQFKRRHLHEESLERWEKKTSQSLSHSEG